MLSLSRSNFQTAVNYLSSEESSSLLIKFDAYYQRLIKQADKLDLFLPVITDLSTWKVKSSTLEIAFVLLLLTLGSISDQDLQQIFETEIINSAKNLNDLRLFRFNREGIEDKSRSHVLRMERLRILFALAYKDLEQALICIAIHKAWGNEINLSETINKRIWAEETEDIYLPLCEMLGLWEVRKELGAISLPIVDRKMFEQLNRYIDQYKKKYADTIPESKSSKNEIPTIYRQIVTAIENESCKHNIALEFDLPILTATSWYRTIRRAELKGQHYEWKDLVDFLRVDVFTNSETECYQALGLIHHLWKPVSGQYSFGKRFFDYIGSPRYNGYQCLMTTIRYEESQNSQAYTLVELRIRTREMEKVNQRGIVATRLQSSPEIRVKNAWWEDYGLVRSVNQTEEGNTGNSIYVFSPIGELFTLIKDSSPIDYAFKVHSALGPYAKNFWVNGQPVPIDYRLRNGDVVQIQYDQSFPSLDRRWKTVVKATSLKNRIERLSKQLDSPHKGQAKIKNVIGREQITCGLWFPDDAVEASLTRIATHLDCSSLTDLFIQVAEGKRSADEIVARVFDDQLVDHIVRVDGQSWSRDRIRIAQCWMTFDKDKKHSRDSRVIPGVEIVGCIANQKSPSPILVVHRKDCPHVSGLAEVIPLKWRTSKQTREVAVFSISAWDRPRILDDILKEIYRFYNQNLYLQRIHAEVVSDGSAAIEFTVDSENLEKIHELKQAIEQLKKSNRIKEVSVWQPLPGQKVLLGGKSSQKHQNPYTLREVRNNNMFFGREVETGKVADLINRGTNLIVLYGHKRVGKTSLLYHLTEKDFSRQMNVLPVLFDTQGITPFDTSSFLVKLSESIDKTIREHFSTVGTTGITRLKVKDTDSNLFWAFNGWLEKVQEKLHGYRLLILVDEFGRAEKAYQDGKITEDFFDGLRWLVNRQPQTFFVFSLQESIYKSARTQKQGSWLFLQRGEPIRLGNIDGEAASRLICQPVSNLIYDQGVLSRLLSLSGCSPFFLNVMCHDIVAMMMQKNYSQVSGNELGEVLKSIFSTGDHYFSHYISEAEKLNHGRELVTAISCTTKKDDEWVERSRIEYILNKEGFYLTKGEMTLALRTISSFGIIESRKGRNEWEYRVPVGLFREWLQNTSSFSTIYN